MRKTRISGRYSIRTKCSNCLNEKRLEIPCGTLVTDVVCEVCGNKTVARASFATPGIRVDA